MNQHHERAAATVDAGRGAYLCHQGGATRQAKLAGSTLSLQLPPSGAIARWNLSEEPHAPQLEWLGPCAGDPDPNELMAAIEASFAHRPLAPRLVLRAPLPQARALQEAGLLVPDAHGAFTVKASMFWQLAASWLPRGAAPCYPLDYLMTGERRHPRRPPKPTGVVYRRTIPWLSATLSFRVATEELDSVRLNRWMNDPVVAEFWQEEGDLDKHRAYLRKQAEDPHTLALIACLDNVPFGYFETYWAREDRIAPFCNAADFDRGWHVLIGEAACRGPAFVPAWLPSISHYLLLDDARTQRLVIEPRADNAKMIRNLGRSGYALEKEFDFPHKRAMLGTLSRERFFGERFWLPRAPDGSKLPQPQERAASGVPAQSLTQ